MIIDTQGGVWMSLMLGHNPASGVDVATAVTAKQRQKTKSPFPVINFKSTQNKYARTKYA